MKKLFFLMGCITALTLMNSCTADSIEDSNSTEINNQQIAPGDIVDPNRPKP